MDYRASVRRCVGALLVATMPGAVTAAAQDTDPGRAVIEATNAARTDPRGFAAHLRVMLPRFQGTLYREAGQTDLRTQEGAAAVQEAIAFLERQAPLPPLAWSPGLARAAADHARDTGPTGRTGHTGADGSSMADRVNRYGRWQSQLGENISYGRGDARSVVIQLIVDDGVASRGHRANIFQPAFLVAGAACGPHQRYGQMCVVDYAGGYDEAQGHGGTGAPNTGAGAPAVEGTAASPKPAGRPPKTLTPRP